MMGENRLYILVAIIFIMASVTVVRRNPKTGIYFAVIYVVTIIYLAFLMREPKQYIRFVLVPFNALKNGIDFDKVSVKSWESIEGIIQNVLLFTPGGYLIPAINSKARKWWVILLLGLFGSLGIELIQLVTRRGFADIDDVINNTVGTLVGYWIYHKVIKNKVI